LASLAGLNPAKLGCKTATFVLIYVYMEEKIAVINNLRVRYLETKGKSDIPLIMLHGWGSSINSWKKVIEHFEKSGIKVFMPDLPGFGETQEPPKPWEVGDYINFVENFTEYLGVKNFALAGHSFGGQIAISYAARSNFKREGSRINALILMSAARIAHHKTLKVTIFRILTKAGNLLFEIPSLKFLKPLIKKIWYKLAGERDYYESSELMRETMKQVVAEKVGDRLEKINIPTLIIWGESDPVTPLGDGKIINERIRGSKMVVFDNEGHDINIKKPGEVAQKIIEFLNRQ